MDFFLILFLSSNDIFYINKNINVGTGLTWQNMKYSSDLANTGNPKVIRGSPQPTANCISADYVEITPITPAQHIPLGVYHTWGFNARN